MSLRDEVGRMVIAPVYSQAWDFCHKMGWDVRYTRIATTEQHLMKFRLTGWEVWWLDGMWPWATHEDVDYMVFMKKYAKSRGADLRHWWT